MSTRVRASVLHGPKDLCVETRVLPPPGPAEIQIDVKATGLCGSDLHYYLHNRVGDIIVKEPMSLGHESAGIVTAVGRDVQMFEIGDHVAIEVGVPCETCDFCVAGRYNICPSMRFRSSARTMPHVQGTLQERLNHPAKWCYKLPAGVPLEHGALAEPLSVAVHAQARAGASAIGGTVLILGAGAVGLLCSAVSRVAGATSIVMADISGERIEFAMKSGFADAGIVVPVGHTGKAETLDDKLNSARCLATTLTAAQVNGQANQEFHVVYECTGAESCVQTAIYAARPGGKVLTIGMGSPVQTVPIGTASKREVDLVGVNRYANTYPEALSLLRDGKARGMPEIGKLVTHRFKGLEAVPEAFTTASKAKDAQGNLVIKVMVEL
ncbi:hypothetical protein SCUCBS95973_002350 [Sporothrix curviconia]|uniref:Enoyl reductase (ER) domain-containing protein n=1 Tax=Sporothrix curviconia TaxID=1260050 RepID=A0ABP0B6B0_9PEZI